jgi:hypothetical protein
MLRIVAIIFIFIAGLGLLAEQLTPQLFDMVQSDNYDDAKDMDDAGKKIKEDAGKEKIFVHYTLACTDSSSCQIIPSTRYASALRNGFAKTPYTPPDQA